MANTFEQGLISHVVRLFNMRRGTVNNLRRCYQSVGSTSLMTRSGCPRIKTPARICCLCTTHLHSEFSTAQRTASTLPGPHRISANTVLRLLHDTGMYARCPVQHLRLAPQHIQALLQHDQISTSDGQVLCSVTNPGHARVYR